MRAGHLQRARKSRLDRATLAYPERLVRRAVAHGGQCAPRLEIDGLSIIHWRGAIFVRLNCWAFRFRWRMSRTSRAIAPRTRRSRASTLSTCTRSISSAATSTFTSPFGRAWETSFSRTVTTLASGGGNCPNFQRNGRIVSLISMRSGRRPRSLPMH